MTQNATTNRAFSSQLVVTAPVNATCRRKARILAGLKDLHDERGNRALVRIDDLVAHIAKRFGKNYATPNSRMENKFREAVEGLTFYRYIKYSARGRMVFLTVEGEHLLSCLLTSRPELFEQTSSPNSKKTP